MVTEEEKTKWLKEHDVYVEYLTSALFKLCNTLQKKNLLDDTDILSCLIPPNTANSFAKDMYDCYCCEFTCHKPLSNRSKGRGLGRP